MKFSISIENPQKITKRAYVVSKRLLDIVGALVGIFLCLVVAVPFFFIYTFDQRNKGPMLYRQQRFGMNGKAFNMYKFRSMVVNAEAVLKADPALYERYVLNSYKLAQHEDPRLTGFGKFIRKTSVDELPQFFNVLKGEMSLVGPRPIVEQELAEYGAKKELFFSVKPGMTGYWQVSGRSEVNYPERVDVELFYHQHQSFMLDLKILALTIIHVILKKGAY